MSVIDQDVDSAIGRDGDLDQASCAVGTADIRSVSRNFGAGLAYSLFHLPQLLGQWRVRRLQLAPPYTKKAKPLES